MAEAGCGPARGKRAYPGGRQEEGSCRERIRPAKDQGDKFCVTGRAGPIRSASSARFGWSGKRKL